METKRETKRAAVFSDQKEYRYQLSRIWDESKNSVCFIGLNPSIANEHRDDNTVSKCVEQAKMLGFGSLEMVNLFAFVDTKQGKLHLVEDPIGPENDSFLIASAKRCETVIVMWGNEGSYKGRSREILEKLRKGRKKLYCLGINSTGEPKHIGRMKYVCEIQNYEI